MFLLFPERCKDIFNLDDMINIKILKNLIIYDYHPKILRGKRFCFWKVNRYRLIGWTPFTNQHQSLNKIVGW